MSILGETLEPFDDDDYIPAYGFGDISTRDKDVFPFVSQVVTSDLHFFNGPLPFLLFLFSLPLSTFFLLFFKELLLLIHFASPEKYILSATPCVDPESFISGGPTLILLLLLFFFWGGRIQIPLSEGQHRHTSETPFKWRFAGVPMIAQY